jgi:hypothetical protein
VQCDCDWLPAEDRDHCESCNPRRFEYKQVSVGRTKPLYESENSALGRIELLVETAYWDGEFDWHQRNIMRWAIRKCRALAETQPTLSDLL